MLERVRIVLVETTHPGNIGATARAMKNMGLCELVLVKPLKFPDGEATARAAGADDLLKNAQIVNDLPAALVGCDWVFGSGAHERSLKWPLINPEEAAQKILAEPHRKVALVFGRESSGLTNEELALCHFHIKIPTVEDFSSLNLAAAVQVLTYALRSAWIKNSTEGNNDSITEAREAVASMEELNGFFEHLEQTLIAIEFLDPKQPKRLIRRLRRLYQRAEPDQTEINILRGILAAMQRKL